MAKHTAKSKKVTKKKPRKSIFTAMEKLAAKSKKKRKAKKK